MATDHEFDKQLGEKIRECRLEAGYSQTNLAQILEFDSPTAISLIERGERSLKIRDLVILADLFMKDYEYFLGRPSKSVRKKTAGSDAELEALARKLLRAARHK